ncbi:hypothetical protein [Leptospira sp. 'Mane']|uniref:hypothetical protein n=1 Tax=Leptospira sp. 'Mane' TaxID=3387407 RepID=UPI00398B6A46
MHWESKKFSRKGFLNRIGFAGLFVVSWACSGAQKAIYLFFSDYELKILEAWCLAVLPDEKNMPDHNKAEVIRRLDEEFYFVSEEIREEFHMAIIGLDYLPFFYGSFSRFHKLTLENRISFLEKTKDTESDLVRAIIGNLKLVTFLAYYGHESTWKQIGYDGPFGNPPEKWSESRIHYKKSVNVS